MSYSLEKEKFIKKTQAEFSKLAISLLTKKSFMKRLEKVTKDMHKEQKEIRKVPVNAAIHLVKTHFEQNKASTPLVAKLPLNSPTKAVSEAIKHVSYRN